MRREQYRQWLTLQKYAAGTITAQLHRAGRLEEHYGDLDALFDQDQLGGLLEILTYTTNDKRAGRENPTTKPIEGDLFSNIASYRDAVKRYRKFRVDPYSAADEAIGESVAKPAPVIAEEEVTQRIGLERDMQAALRQRIEQLEQGLVIIDDGAERSVDSGFIDITARDECDTTVVIELKTGVAGQRAVAQILSYMGDVLVEQEGDKVRGILVAADFDAKAKAAARMVPNLSLRRYSVRFHFSDGAD